MAEDTKPDKNSDANVRDAIMAFEQILEAIPDDRVALEMLAEAHEQAGNKDKAVEYLARLGHAVVAEGDVDAAAVLVGKLRELGAGHSAADRAIAQLDRLLSFQKTSSSDRKAADTGRRKNVDIANELSMAWNILQAGGITQEEYSAIVHDLSENSSKNVAVPVSVMHVLHDRNFKTIENIVGFLVKDKEAGLPLITLTGFDIQSSSYSLLPIEFMRHRGAIVFEQMGRDLLVAVLNPYDFDLREEVKTTTGRPCHFYLVTASDYDTALENISKAIKQAQQEAEKV